MIQTSEVAAAAQGRTDTEMRDEQAKTEDEKMNVDESGAQGIKKVEESKEIEAAGKKSTVTKGGLAKVLFG